MRILEKRSFLPRPTRIFWIDANRQFSFATNKKISGSRAPHGYILAMFGNVWQRLATFGYVWLCLATLAMFGYVLATNWLRIGKHYLLAGETQPQTTTTAQAAGAATQKQQHNGRRRQRHNNNRRETQQPDTTICRRRGRTATFEDPTGPAGPCVGESRPSSRDTWQQSPSCLKDWLTASCSNINWVP